MLHIILALGLLGSPEIYGDNLLYPDLDDFVSGSGVAAGLFGLQVCVQDQDDLTPGVGFGYGPLGLGCNIMILADNNTGATAITTFDGIPPTVPGTPGSILYVIAPATAANFSSIADSGNFELERVFVQPVTGQETRILILSCRAANTFKEVNRHNGPRHFDDQIEVEAGDFDSDFPNAQMVVGHSDTGDTSNDRIGLVGEATADGSNESRGLQGIGTTSSAEDGAGILGIGHVAATGDNTTAYGSITAASDTHVGGPNVSSYCTASGGATNYCLQLGAGDINSLAAVNWLMLDNSATALTWDAAGAADILAILTSDGEETVAHTSKFTGASALDAASGDEYAWDLAYTTDKLTSGDDYGLRIRQTDTASPATSYLLDVGVGANSQFYVTNTGIMTLYGSSWTDAIQWYHDETDAYQKWLDGNMIFMTDEATNSPTILEAKPKGSSEVSSIGLYDTDGQRLYAYTAADRAYVESQGGALGFQVAQVQDVHFWESIASGNPSINIYGWNTAGSDRESTALTMDDANDEFLIQAANSANHEGITTDLTETNQQFRIRQNSDVLGVNLDGADAYARWSDGNLILMTDEATNSPTAVEFKPKGSSEVSSLGLYDTDTRELWLHTAANRGYIQSGTGALGIQNTIVQDVLMWEGIGSGNPSLILSGWNTAGSDLESTELTMDDANDEFLIRAASSVNHEGITIELDEANQLFRVRGSDGAVDFSSSDTALLAVNAATFNSTLDAESYMALGNGSALNSNKTLIIDRDFSDTSDGEALSVVGSQIEVTAGTGDIHHTMMNPGATTFSTAATLHGYASTLTLLEPNIALNDGATLSHATTLRIVNAPTEGTTSNWALWIDSGDMKADGALTVDGLTTLGGGLLMGGDLDFADYDGKNISQLYREAPVSDAAVTNLDIIGENAYSQATVNTAGADINIASGIGRRFFTMDDITECADNDTFDITVDGATTNITADTDFVCTAAGSEAAAACNLYDYIIANPITGMLPGRTDGTCSDAKVFIIPDEDDTFAVALDMTDGGGGVECATETEGTDGDILFHTAHNNLEIDGATGDLLLEELVWLGGVSDGYYQTQNIAKTYGVCVGAAAPSLGGVEDQIIFKDQDCGGGDVQMRLNGASSRYEIYNNTYALFAANGQMNMTGPYGTALVQGADQAAASAGMVEMKSEAAAEMTGASGTQYGLKITSEFNQSSVANYTGIYLNVDDNSDSGTDNYLIDLQDNSASRWSLSTAGDMFMQRTPTTDVAAVDAEIFAANADDQASAGANRNGADFHVSAGVRTLQIVCSDSTKTDTDLITFTVDGAATVLTESTDYDCEGVSNEVCCDNLGTEITAQIATLKMVPDCDTTAGTCYLTPAKDVKAVDSIVIADGGVDGLGQSLTEGTDGSIALHTGHNAFVVSPTGVSIAGNLTLGEIQYLDDDADSYITGTETDDVIRLHSNIGAGSGYTEITNSNNAGFLAVGRTTATEGSRVSIVDGGADNSAGELILYADDGNGNFFWTNTADQFRAGNTEPADDDAGGYAIMSLADGTIGATGQAGTFATLTSAGVRVITPGDQELSAAETLIVTSAEMTLYSDGGAVVSTADPALTNGTADGEVICVMGTSDANTIQWLDEAGGNPGSTLELDGGVAFTFELGHRLCLRWYAAGSKWYETGRTAP